MSAFGLYELGRAWPLVGGLLPPRKIDGIRDLVAIPIGRFFTEATFLEGMACALSARFARQFPCRVVPDSQVCVGKNLNLCYKPMTDDAVVVQLA